MNKKQKQILANFAVVIVVTIAAVIGMIELKNQVNRSEAMRSMEQLEQAISDYRQKNGSVPPETYVKGLREKLEGQVRMGNLHYRAQWIGFDSTPETILAYVKKDYHSLFSHSGAIIIRLDGRVEWLDKGDFDKLPIRQQSAIEYEMAPK